MRQIHDTETMNLACENLKALVYMLCTPPQEEWEYYKSQMTLMEYKAGEFFMKPGDTADIYGYIHTGLVKRYYVSSDGDPVVFSFDGQGKLITDLPSLLKNVPAQLNIQFLRDSKVLVTPPGFYRAIRERHVVWQESARRITEIKYLEFVERSLDLLSMKAVDRYKKFVNRHVELLPHIDKKDIAAYIGVTPNSLSRLLRSINEEDEQVVS